MASVSRRGGKDGHDPEGASHPGMSTEDEVDQSEATASSGGDSDANATGADLDEGDLDFLEDEENDSED